MSNHCFPSSAPYPLASHPAVNFSRSLAMSARFFFPQLWTRKSSTTAYGRSPLVIWKSKHSTSPTYSTDRTVSHVRSPVRRSSSRSE